MDNSSGVKIEFPTDIINQGKVFFTPKVFQDGIKLFQRNKAAISFSRGTPSNDYYVVSGIVKDNKNFETKIIYKKENLETSTHQKASSQIKSTCSCPSWDKENHCQHAVCLFMSFCLQHKYKNKNDILNESSLPPLAPFGGHAVNVSEYGTIIPNASKLIGASANATYSSLQYLLHNNRIVSFPEIDSFSGKLVIKFFSQKKNFLLQEVNNNINEAPGIRPEFVFLFEQSNVLNEKISIFEGLYLFDWHAGKTYSLPRNLQEFVRKSKFIKEIPGNVIDLKINKCFEYAQFQNHNHNNLKFMIDEINIDLGIENDSPDSIFSAPKIIIETTNDKNILDLTLSFYDKTDLCVNPPDIFLSLVFSEQGKMSSFKTKQEAYLFIETLISDLQKNSDNYKKKIVNNPKKELWIEAISNIQNLQSHKTIDVDSGQVIVFNNEILKQLLISFFKSFGENFFRFPEYRPNEKMLLFKLSKTVFYDGIFELYRFLDKFQIPVYYNKTQIKSWKSNLKFERKTSTTNWFNLELQIDYQDYEVIKNTVLEKSFAISNGKLILLNSEQKDLLRFIRKTIGDNNQKHFFEKSDNEILDEINNGSKARSPTEQVKLVLPFNKIRIFELFELKKMGIHGALTEDEEMLCEKLLTLQNIPEYTISNNLEKILRPYQKVGHNWLNFLFENKLGACLADDMGLGKTLQTISFIQRVYEKIEKVLIVCPVSILLNWEKEFAKFSTIPTYLYHGGTRDIPKDTKIILTSYGVMKKEFDGTLSSTTFSILILDEVQQLKNFRSLGAFAARQIKAEFRMCLTGTPVENDLAEFYNIIDLCVPGIWGGMQIFKSGNGGLDARLIARKTVRPFILRRTKAQVLKELPEKIENIVYLQMGRTEKLRYAEKLLMIKERIKSAESKSKYGEILKGLLELRQACLWQKTNAGTLYNNDESSDELELHNDGIESSKMSFLIEQLEQIIKENHQAIVFSQFTTYLDIIQKVIIKKQWTFSRIDGTQTINKRQVQVENFQNGTNPIFLISLKAGGLGLNLTAASYVFIMDPWWNPAVESQAVDRAHRIGQMNRLTVYRPVIKDSVEEKVLELQKSKKELFNDLLPDDENIFSGKLTMKDFEMLLT